jgi:polyisoprenoid-binding protein YceI
METGIDMRDQHMRSSDWLDSDRYPVIRFDLGVLTPKDVIQKGKGKWFVQAKGDIVIKGIPKSISVPVDIRLDESSALKKVIIEGRFKIRLEDHGIRGPAAMRMIGVRVSPDVNVSFKLVGLAEKNWEK